MTFSAKLCGTYGRGLRTSIRQPPSGQKRAHTPQPRHTSGSTTAASSAVLADFPGVVTVLAAVAVGVLARSAALAVVAVLAVEPRVPHRRAHRGSGGAGALGRRPLLALARRHGGEQQHTGAGPAARPAEPIERHDLRHRGLASGGLDRHLGVQLLQQSLLAW